MSVFSCKVEPPAPAALPPVATPIAAAPTLAKPRSEPIVLEVLRINLLQLQGVDHLTQTFSARYFVHLRIRSGASDPDLVRDIYDKEPDFPKDTLRPGAGWFLRQLDLPTALEHRFIDPKIVRVADDVDLVFKVTGTFFSTMQLRHFPVDAQKLSLLLSVNCAEEGIVPVKFKVTRDTVITVAKGTFALSNLWDLHDTCVVEQEKYEVMTSTTYPALRISCLVTRKPVYFFVNVIIPMSSLTFLALLQFFLAAERHATNTTFRITYTVTILLTTATYKLFIASALPVGLAYMTLLDEYVLFCYLLQVLVVSETAVVGALVMRSDTSAELGNLWLPQWATSAGDLICALTCWTAWVVGHVYFYSKTRRASTQKLREELALFHANRKALSGESFTRYRHRASFGSAGAARVGLPGSIGDGPRTLKRSNTFSLGTNRSDANSNRSEGSDGSPSGPGRQLSLIRKSGSNSRLPSTLARSNSNGTKGAGSDRKPGSSRSDKPAVV